MTKFQQALAEADAAVLTALIDADSKPDGRPADIARVAHLAGLTLDLRRAKPEQDQLATDPRARWSAAVLLGSVLFTRRGGASGPACTSADLEQPWTWWQLDEQRAYAYAFASALLLPARILLRVSPAHLAQAAIVPAQVADERINPPTGRILDDVNWAERTFALTSQPAESWELV